VIAAFIVVAALAAQDAKDIERRVGAVADGEVRLQFAARPGVVGDGRSFIAWDCEGGRCRHQHTDGDWDNASRDWRSLYEPGPVRVSLRVRERAVVGIKTYVGGAWRPSDHVTDLGTVSTSAAASYLLTVARRETGRQSGNAIFAATLADSVTIWRDLLAIARDRDVRNDTRKQAVFWLGQAAEEAATAGLDSLAGADDEAVEVREAAIFALSQRPREEGIPALLRIAREHPDPRLRRRAMFWLAQSNDPRALELFEEILTRK
jgi:HEAT repeat protein